VPRPRPTPSTPPQPSCGRCQRTDVRCQTALSLTRRSEPFTAASDSDSPIIAPWDRCADTAPADARASAAHTHAQARPHLEGNFPPGMMAGPASRSRLASRCHKIRCQRTDVRCQTAAGPAWTAAATSSSRHPAVQNSFR
jgi:hypothetical protein